MPDRTSSETASRRERSDVLGQVYGVSGSSATIGLEKIALADREHAVTVGKFLKIHAGSLVLVGVVTGVSTQNYSAAREQGFGVFADVDLLGEISGSGSSKTSRLGFRRGVRDYPTIGDLATPLSTEELSAVFATPGRKTIGIGTLQQDATVPASVDVDEMLNKHFAVLGSTGVGKSSGVAHILMQTMLARPELRIFLIDAHNEYDRSFGKFAYVVNPGNLKLPFWLFNFEEMVDVLFGGRPALQDEVEILAEVIPLAKANYSQVRVNERAGLRKFDAKNIGYTVDTPVPYRLADLISMIDERMGKLENRSSRMIYHKLITRIEMVSNDPRYVFMFEGANVGGDTMAEAISQLFRLPANGKPMTIMQLAGFPGEVVDAVVSVLARLAFDFGLWSEGSNPLLFVCEEAHKYAPADSAAGFIPTRRAISRIAKEGRKYGVYLGLVTQRPAELDPTIISQCGTLFAMRLSNDRDQAFLRAAVADTTANLLAFVPSLGTREALAFGAGIPLPTRLTFSTLPDYEIPRSEAAAKGSRLQGRGGDMSFIASVIDRWRTTGVSANTKSAAKEDSEPAPEPHEPSPAHATSVDPSRLSLLRRPAAERPDPYARLQRPASAHKVAKYPHHQHPSAEPDAAGFPDRPLPV